MAWTTSDKVMELREKSRPFDLFAEMMDGWRRHLSGRNASLVAFFGFLSIFPLLLAAVSILGFVLSGNADLQEQIINGAADEIPVLGEDLKDPEGVDGSVLAIAIGLGIALLSATKVFIGLHSALDDTWEVPVDDRTKTPILRLKALAALVIIAVPQIGSLVLASLVQSLGLPAIGNIAIIVGTVVMNMAVIATMYKFLTSYPTTWRGVLTGAVFAGAIFTILQSIGPWFVKRQADGSTGAMVTINVILGLLGWLSLIGITLLMCAELNAARQRLSSGNAIPDAPEMRLAVRTS